MVTGASVSSALCSGDGFVVGSELGTQELSSKQWNSFYSRTQDKLSNVHKSRFSRRSQSRYGDSGGRYAGLNGMDLNRRDGNKKCDGCCQSQ